VEVFDGWSQERGIRYARAVRFPRGQLKRFSSPRSSRLTFARCKTITDPPETAANAITGQGSCRTTAAVGKATAATSDATVQRVYDRGQFEQNWMTSTGGIVYVIHPASVSLPTSPLGNW